MPGARSGVFFARAFPLLVLVPIGVAFSCCGLVILVWRATLLQSTDRALAEHTATLRAAVEGIGDGPALKQLLRRVEASNEGVAIALVNQDGERVMGVGAIDIGALGAPLQRVLEGQPAAVVELAGAQSQVVHIERGDLTLDGQSVRAIVVAHDRRTEKRAVERTLLAALMIAILVSVGTGAVSFHLSRRVGRKLSALMDASRRVAEGDLDVRLDERPLMSLERLAQGFNAMTQALRDTQRNLDASMASHAALEQRFRHAEALAIVGQVASSFAHEIGSPLNTILGWARLGQADTTSPDARESFEIIGAQCERIRRIVEKMLGVARPTTSERGAVEVGAVVQEVADFLSRDAATASVSLTLDLGENSTIWGARDQVLEVVMNLVVNAIQAQPQGGKVHVQVEPSKDQVRLIVSDAGPGIPEVDRERIFEPFFTTKTDPNARGTGLGLAIVREIVLAAGGAIRVGEADAGGAAFYVTFPSKGPEIEAG